MNKFFCENQGTHTYLIYEAPLEANIDKLSLGMMTNNKIKGFLPFIYTQMDGKSQFKYEISAKVSLSQYVSSVLNRHKVLTIFRTITETILASEEYMIESASFVMDLEYMYVDVTTAEVELICLPLKDRTENNIGLFFKEMIYNTNIRYDASENCDYVVKIINFLNGSPIFSLVDFRSLLDSLDQLEIQTKSSNADTPAIHYLNRQVEEELKNPDISEVKTDHSENIFNVKKNTNKENQNYIKELVYEEKNIKEIFGSKNPKKNEDIFFDIPGQSSNAEPVSSEKKKRFSFWGGHSKKNEKQKDSKKQEKKKAGFFSKQKEDEQFWEESFGVFPVNEMVSSREARSSVEQKVEVQDYKKEEYGSSLERGRINFGTTTVFDEENERGTVCLVDEEKKNITSIRAKLIRVRNNQSIPIDKSVFKIGYLQDYVDYYVDNPAVSRSHAMIIRKNEEFFIIDTNSSNHTYVEGQMIVSNSEVLIRDRARIRLANEEFIFRIY